MRLSSPRSILGALTLAAGLAGVSPLTLTFSGCQGTTPDDLPTGTNSTGLIFVKSTNSRTVDINFVPSRGSDLFSLKPISPNGELRNLTASLKGAVADPEISYDGLKVLFALRSDPGDRWHIHEMNVDGANLRQLTNDPDRDDCDPAYLPNGKIVFCSNRPNYRDEYNRRPVEVMHTMNPDGSDIQCISFNNSDDFDPIVLRDGRVAWTRWDHHGAQNRFPLFLTKPDGRSTFLLFGPHNRNFFHPRELEDGNLVAVVSTRVLKDTGPLAILKSTQTTSDPPEDDDFKVIHEGAFKYPHPLPDGRLLASYAPGGEESNFGLYTLNRDGSNLSLLYDDPEAHELDAVVVAPRPKPPVIPERIDKSATSGVFINENVYFRQTKDGQRVPEPGEVKQVMVIEGIRVTPGERNINIGMTSFERKRVLGVTPVYEDGSFAIRVPANTPISFNSLDSLGRAVVIKRNWIYARPGGVF